jgi:hypothetical protein
MAIIPKKGADFDYCNEEEKKPPLKESHIKLYTKKGQKCILPYKFKGKEHETCIEGKKEPWCPIKVNDKGRMIVRPKKGVDFDYC